MYLLNAVLFFALLATCCADVAQFTACDGVSEDVCQVTALDITPCKNKKCIIRKKHDASLAFDYIPNFNATNVESGIFWASDTGDLPFPGMDQNGCLYTKCPVSAGQANTLSYTLYIGKKIPTGNFKLKLKLSNKDNPTQLCCLQTNIQIKK